MMTICGYRTGVLWDATRPNWRDTGKRPIAWSAWYPTKDTAGVEKPDGQFFDLGDDFTDSRIASLVAFAPAPPIRSFLPQAVARIKLPATILTGNADRKAVHERSTKFVFQTLN